MNINEDTPTPSLAPGRELRPKLPPLALKIGVMGGSGRNIGPEFLERAELLGEAVGSQGCVLITGACPGLPLSAARGANRRGGLVIGISPGLSLDEHVYKYESPSVHHDVVIFTGSGLMGREVVNIRSSDNRHVARRRMRHVDRSAASSRQTDHRGPPLRLLLCGMCGSV